jgi:LysR family transcriptional regulator, low CO2-responsive transcriptional regulator
MFTTQLKSFFTVARTGSFTQAARQLGISQPTVTAQIKALEANYGVELFHRGGRRLELTEVGASLMPKALDLFSREIEIDFLLRNSAAMEGNLRVGITAPYFLMPVVGQFCQKHARVGVSLTMGNSAQVLEALDDYRVDVAASSHYLNDSRLMRLELAQTPIVLVVHRSHRLARRETVPLSAIAEERLLLREEGSITRSITERMLKEAGVQPASSLEIGSREAIREAIVLNMGVSTIGLKEVPNHPDLKVLHFADSEAMLSEYLYCLHDRREARLIEAFMAEARVIYSV